MSETTAAAAATAATTNTAIIDKPAAATAVEGGNTPWGWLGLLKWSLAYSDGTSETKHSPMSAEDKAFLEKVMKEGIIDENERMKEILKVVTEGLEEMRSNSISSTTSSSSAGGDETAVASINSSKEMEDEIGELLQELRDIVEQIDYARAFAAMKGLDFLLGCAAQPEVPKVIRMTCLGVLATMISNNPPIQKEMLEMGGIKTLSEFFQSTPAEDSVYRAKVMQALSGAVRSDDLSEQVFCGVDQARQIVLEGLQGAEILQKRTLFFFRALITSDTATRARVRLFAHAVAFVTDHLVTASTSPEIREMALELLVQILEHKKSVNTVLSRKDALVATGVQQVAALRGLTGEERDYASVELEAWENLLVQLARTTPDGVEETPETPLLIGAANPEVEPQ